MVKRKFLWTTGLVLLVGLLAAAGYTAVFQLANQSNMTNGTGALPLVTGGEDEVTMGVNFDGAAELPDRSPDTWGVLLLEEDGRYLVGSGPNSVNVTEVDGQLQAIPHHEGPEVEVVANRNTIFYEDITDVSAAAASMASGEMTFQQQVRQVEPPAQMPTAANFLVWGERRGERLVAEVILFRDEGYE